MNALFENVQILRGNDGTPAFAVIPFAEYQALKQGREPGVPAEVAEAAILKDISALRAWRDYLGLTQTEVAARLGITQSAYAQIEAKKTIRASRREAIAAALGLHESQLDF